jgi:hypothetical protein
MGSFWGIWNRKRRMFGVTWVMSEIVRVCSDWQRIVLLDHFTCQRRRRHPKTDRITGLMGRPFNVALFTHVEYREMG